MILEGLGGWTSAHGMYTLESGEEHNGYPVYASEDESYHIFYCGGEWHVTNGDYHSSTGGTCSSGVKNEVRHSAARDPIMPKMDNLSKVSNSRIMSYIFGCPTAL